MTNDETRMTNEARNPKFAAQFEQEGGLALSLGHSFFRHSSLVIRHSFVILVSTFVILCLSPSAFPLPPSPAIAARVGDDPIDSAEVTRLVEAASRPRRPAKEAIPVLQAQVLAELVNRRLVLAYARRMDEEPRPEELADALAQLQTDLGRRRQSLSEFLNSRGITAADLRRQILWNLVWEKYLARYVTPARLEAYFSNHRRELDGTELEVSHILLRETHEDGRGKAEGGRAGAEGKPSAISSRQGLADLLGQAQRIRQQIVGGQLSMADAARKYSAGPSARQGGKLGFIPRRGVMDESFSRAAFALAVGQVSQPVQTPFGVHLIRCDGVKPGTRSLADVRGQVEEALARELLEKLAARQRPHTRVEFTGRLPYFKPGTRELVQP
jgi:hypothetical protein